MLKLKEYKLLRCLPDEIDALESFSEYSSGYICDVISEIADNYIPIYHSDIWEYVKEIQDYIEEAIDEGLTPEDSSLDGTFQAGYYKYYTQSLYDNLESLIFNYITSAVNNHITSNGISVNTEKLTDYIEMRASELDNNDRIDHIEDEIDGIIEEIGIGEFDMRMV